VFALAIGFSRRLFVVTMGCGALSWPGQQNGKLSKTRPFSNGVCLSAGRNPISAVAMEVRSIAIPPGIAQEQENIVNIPMSLFRKEQSLALWCFPVLLSLSGCGDAGPECGTPDVRNSVVKIISDDRNNSLVNYAAQNSDSVAELVRKSASATEAEKSAILEKAKQDAIYTLDDTIVVNSRSRAASACTGLLYVRIGDTIAQKEVNFTVEQTADGKTSVSVKPFLF
jgi:hypothetical protein